ncbi:hypothetical protein [Mariniflexile sp.]|uniref:hypothetical protein n=1 Tax=Mariniflexile sp. TaxID=1979402 RepID=UPI0040472C4A
MKHTILTYTLLIFIISSCSNSETDSKPFNAIVLQKGLDCGNSYLIKFNDGVSGLPQNAFNNVFYEINLPDAYKVEGKPIYATFRLPKDNEYMACTTLGIGYPAIYITIVK